MEKEILSSFIEKGLTQRQIGDKFKISHTAVRYWLKKFNLKTKIQFRKKSSIINGCKKCIECKKNKSIDEFYMRTDKKNYASKCKKCANEYYGKRIKDVKLRMIIYKGCKCKRCALNLKDTHYSVFEFHHRDPKEKDVNFAKIKYQKWDVIEKEIDKCDLLCANCHRLEHAKIEGW